MLSDKLRNRKYIKKHKTSNCKIIVTFLSQNSHAHRSRQSATQHGDRDKIVFSQEGSATVATGHDFTSKRWWY